ncbi:hypothetical protein TrLO_g850 [Triparma laevis f. longispina]|uniref:Uncharacterized protein n=1 Tax=Triparma laevis f. longispina TaxID=1714387 RepID=A0A9W7FT11_9STRA|nr:hypothetical protein TrLO_g850 [Triparma laevis f. longispina]
MLMSPQHTPIRSNIRSTRVQNRLKSPEGREWIRRSEDDFKALAFKLQFEGRGVTSPMGDQLLARKNLNQKTASTLSTSPSCVIVKSSLLSIPTMTSTFTFNDTEMGPGVNLFNSEIKEGGEEESTKGFEEEEEVNHFTHGRVVPRAAVLHIKCMREIERLKRKVSPHKALHNHHGSIPPSAARHLTVMSTLESMEFPVTLRMSPFKRLLLLGRAEPSDEFMKMKLMETTTVKAQSKPAVVSPETTETTEVEEVEEVEKVVKLMPPPKLYVPQAIKLPLHCVTTKTNLLPLPPPKPHKSSAIASKITALKTSAKKDKENTHRRSQTTPMFPTECSDEGGGLGRGYAKWAGKHYGVMRQIRREVELK